VADRRSRRGNGEGSITKLGDGRWQARVTLDDGRRKAFYGKTRAETAAKLHAALRDRERGLPVVAEKQTLGQFLALWLDMVKDDLKPRTWKRYNELMMLHVVPLLGTVRLAKLQPQHLQQLYVAKRAENLSPTTVHHVATVLHGALKKAERLGLVARNVSEMVDTPRMARREMQVLDREQARRLLEAVRNDHWEALYVLALHTGMREGELLALRWRDLNLAKGTLQVRSSLYWTKESGYKLDAPKTASSRRPIKLDPRVVEILGRHKARQAEVRLALGPAWEDQDLVLPNAVGRPMDAMNLLHYHFYPLLKRAGLPRVRFHDLRHTAATIMLGEGINPKVVSERLGHANVSITLSTYSHVLPDIQEEAAAKVATALGL
jgi:integrase